MSESLLDLASTVRGTVLSPGFPVGGAESQMKAYTEEQAGFNLSHSTTPRQSPRSARPDVSMRTVSTPSGHDQTMINLSVDRCTAATRPR